MVTWSISTFAHECALPVHDLATQPIPIIDGCKVTAAACRALGKAEAGPPSVQNYLV